MPNGSVLKTWGIVGLACGLMLFVGSAAAATRYVSDDLTINMRSGAGNQYRISHQLHAGTKLETLGTSNGWTHVRTASGRSGYVLTRFLSDEPAARDQLPATKKKLDQLQSKNAELREELAKAENGSAELGKTKNELVSKNKKLRNELQDIRAASADAIRISKQNKDFRQKIMNLRSDVERLKHDNAALQSRRDGMTIGALILVGGIILGLVLPMLRRGRRKGGWNSL